MTTITEKKEEIMADRERDERNEENPLEHCNKILI